MALSSMTGFAQSSGEKDGLHWQWEIKSVNGKALDLRCRLPTGFEALEAIALFRYPLAALFLLLGLPMARPEYRPLVRR